MPKDDDVAERVWRGSLPLSYATTVHTLARVAVENPSAIRLAAQLLGVPACPKCDYVMKPGHICYADAPTYDPQDPPSPEYGDEGSTGEAAFRGAGWPPPRPRP